MYFSFDKKLGHELCIWDKICNKLSCYNWVWIPKKSQVNKNQVFESARSSRNFIVLKFSFHFLFFIRTLAGRRKAPQQGGEMGCVQGKWKLFCFFICLLFQVRQHFFACLIISVFRQVDPHGRGHRLHRAQHRHEARGGGDPVQDVLAKAPGWQDLQEELPHDDEGVLPRSSAANRLLGIMVHGLGVKIMMNMIIIVDGLVAGADTEKLERHIFRMYDSNKVGGGTLPFLGVVFFEIL